MTCCLAKDPEDRFDAITGPNSFLDALENAKLVDDSEPVLRDLGITRHDVRAAYGMARIGHAKARQRLLSWCSQEMEERREQAAITLAKLDKGLEEIIGKAGQLCADKSGKSLPSIVHALSCVLRQQEDSSPRAWGQKWLRELANNLPKMVKKAYVSDNLQRLRSTGLTVYSRYAIISALFAGFGSLPATAFAGNVLYRTHPGDASYFSYFAVFFFGAMMTGILWGGLFPLAYHLGRTCERPRRFLMIFLACSVAFCLSTLGILAFMQTQGKGVIADELGSKNVIVLLSQYFAVLSLLCSIPFTLYFLIKEVAKVQLRLPSFFLSIIFLPFAVTCFSALTVPLFADRGFLRVELWGELMIVFGAILGAGLADWRLDVQNRDVRFIRGIRPAGSKSL